MNKYEIVLDKSKLSEYHLGRIYGMAYILAGGHNECSCWHQREDRSEISFHIECSEVQYISILHTIDNIYPGVIKTGIYIQKKFELDEEL